ncbi:MAG: ASCH domain-containing protein [Myxococcota bacterium]
MKSDWRRLQRCLKTRTARCPRILKPEIHLSATPERCIYGFNGCPRHRRTATLATLGKMLFQLKDPRHIAFWAEAEDALRCISRTRLRDAGPFDDNEDGAAYCAHAVFEGTKTATSTLAATARDFTPGDLELVTEFDGTPRALIEITYIDQACFGEIDDGFAVAEGDGTLAQWRETHLRCYGARMAERGETLDERTPLLRIFFRRLYP